MVRGRAVIIALGIAFLLLTSEEALAQNPQPQQPFFTQGNLVVAVSGCGIWAGGSGGTCDPVGGTGASTGTGAGTYGDDQGAPWNLFQFSCPGTCLDPSSLASHS